MALTGIKLCFFQMLNIIKVNCSSARGTLTNSIATSLKVSGVAGLTDGLRRHGMDGDSASAGAAIA